MRRSVGDADSARVLRGDDGGVGIPVYVLIHRQEGKAYAFSEPVPGDDPATAHYATKVEVELGRSLPLPTPYPSLDTSVLLNP
ncbi:hypothetical protein AB0O07_24365 [Streptomyces sp. NPDC093085]|uniref:hypothetical protein n=1 Tax=Streptomyces sp. NPDC093085 TaxID=3155068 RepID=UPI0034441446